ncbi:MAG: helix-turn-helix domain-containing protein [Nostocaceae cyanobacterium]|nr:helix-turn-helix domain-containing protein [Nostocaceae cyanobacterium]
MTITLDRKIYGSLLEKYQPKAINSEDDYNRTLESIEELMERGEELSFEENSLLEMLSILVENYENYQFSQESASPQEVLLHLMDARKLKQSDLVEVIGSKGLVSEIVNGKRSISKSQAKALGEFFHVSPALFI